MRQTLVFDSVILSASPIPARTRHGDHSAFSNRHSAKA